MKNIMRRKLLAHFKKYWFTGKSITKWHINRMKTITSDWLSVTKSGSKLTYFARILLFIFRIISILELPIIWGLVLGLTTGFFLIQLSIYVISIPIVYFEEQKWSHKLFYK